MSRFPTSLSRLIPSRTRPLARSEERAPGSGSAAASRRLPPAYGVALADRQAVPVGMPARPWTRPAIGPADDAAEREATAMADRTAAHAPAGRLRLGPAAPAPPGASLAPPLVQQAISAPGEPLERSTRSALEPQFGRDFSRVRVHTDAAADASARAVAAEAYTVGNHIAFAAGRYAPWTPAGMRLLTHELAHVAQQAAASGAGQAWLLQRQPTSFGGYPESERRTIRQSTVPATMVTAEFLLQLFGTAAQAGGATTTHRFGGQTIFDPAIPAALHRGLQSTGAFLAHSTNVLPLGSTVTLVLDLTRFSGPVARYRFSHFTHAEPRSPAARVLLIEQLGAAPAVIASRPVPTGPFTVGGHSFTARGGWSAVQFGRLVAVLERLPTVVLSEAAGTAFSLSGTGTADEAGRYIAERDEIEIHTNAFPASPSTFGGADAGMRAITHEIGHLLDLRRLERAWRSFNAGGQTAQGRRTLKTTRSLSGTRWRLPAGAGVNWEQVDVRTTVQRIDFREAAARDGIRPGRTATDPLTGAPTQYGDTDWQELFAETFSLHVNDPALLALVRPNLSHWFSREFPLPVTPAAYAVPSTSPPGP
jgi:hypothetical protein